CRELLSSGNRVDRCNEHPCLCGSGWQLRLFSTEWSKQVLHIDHSHNGKLRGCRLADTAAPSSCLGGPACRRRFPCHHGSAGCAPSCPRHDCCDGHTCGCDCV